MGDFGVRLEMDDSRFKEALRRAGLVVRNLSLPFKMMYYDWLKGNKGVFVDTKLSGWPNYKGEPMKSTGLTPYEWHKVKHSRAKSPLPMLQFSGAMADSMLSPSAKGAYFAIAESKMGFVMGTTIATKDGFPYPHAIQYGTPNMDARPFLFIGGEQVQGTNNVNMRLEGWIKILEDHIGKSLGMRGAYGQS